VADYGVRLGPQEQRRRWVIQSLLYHEGLSLPGYTRRFGTDAFEDMPALIELETLELARAVDGWLSLTEAGVERSDTIGPWLYSAEVCTLMETYAWR
jgi:oxygen-independent coproporphyrinogen-3 oxidase